MGPPAVLVEHHQIVEVGEGALGPFVGELLVVEILDGVFDDDEAGVGVLQLLDESAEQLFGVESDELGSAVVHEDFDRVVHLAELPEENLRDFVELHALLDQVFLDEVVFGRPVDQRLVLLVARPRLLGLEDELSLVEFPVAEVDAFSGDQFAVPVVGNYFSRFHILVLKELNL